jgi:hypothetical protein
MINDNIDSLGLTTLTRNALFQAGIKKVSQLSHMDLSDLKKVFGLGNKGIEAIALSLPESLIAEQYKQEKLLALKMEKLTIKKAEEQIAGILRQLEIDQDIVVKDISAEAMDLTSLDDDRQRLKMRVVIETERLPGREW